MYTITITYVYRKYYLICIYRWMDTAMSQMISLSRQSRGGWQVQNLQGRTGQGRAAL